MNALILSAVAGEVRYGYVPIVSTVENKIGHKTPGSIFHEDTILFVIGTAALDHLKSKILKTCSLRDLPMDSRSGCC